jgi:uncharacterized DUF497 family protein
LKIESVEWDDINVKHIARHGVSQDEVEDICYGRHVGRKNGKTRYVLSGQTREGKYLNIVIQLVYYNEYRPITAYPMNENQKTSFRRTK